MNTPGKNLIDSKTISEEFIKNQPALQSITSQVKESHTGSQLSIYTKGSRRGLSRPTPGKIYFD